MEIGAQPKPANPLRAHALCLIRASGYISAGAAVLFLASLPFTPHSPAYWATAAATGAASFPLLWRHWRRPSNLLLSAIIILLLISSSEAERAFFPDRAGSISWLLLAQFLCLYLVAELSLVYCFRRRLRESIDN